MFGNVPKNEILDLVNIDALSEEELENTRLSYEHKWNQFNTVRTTFSVLALIMLLLVIFSKGNEVSIEN